MSEHTPISEDRNGEVVSLSEKEKLHNECTQIVDDIKGFLGELKVNYNNEPKFEELLRVIHGRFSKIELNLISLEKK